MELWIGLFLLTLAYALLLRVRLGRQQREFDAFRQHMFIVPLPNKRTSPVLWLFGFSTLLLAFALVILMLR